MPRRQNSLLADDVMLIPKKRHLAQDEKICLWGKS